MRWFLQRENKNLNKMKCMYILEENCSAKHGKLQQTTFNQLTLIYCVSFATLSNIFFVGICAASEWQSEQYFRI